MQVFEVLAGDYVRVAENIADGDAQLIAAAPDLLTALEDMLLWLDDGNRQLSDACAVDVKKARLALAKARGEA